MEIGAVIGRGAREVRTPEGEGRKRVGVSIHSMQLFVPGTLERRAKGERKTHTLPDLSNCWCDNLVMILAIKGCLEQPPSFLFSLSSGRLCYLDPISIK